MEKYVTDINNGIYIKKDKLHGIGDVNNRIVINKDNVIGEWLGMGGAITEASAYNYSLLSDEKKKEVIDAYYALDGLNYDFGRISIASNDFSLAPYEYVKDNIEEFSIEHDHKYIIPMLQDIYDVKRIALIASPWSPPTYMKNNKSLLQGGSLKKKYYLEYANYLGKFLKEYKGMGFDIPYITMQNEPFAKQRWESCLFSLKEQKDFVYGYLYGVLDNTKVLLWDHNRENLVKVVDKLYVNNNIIGGIGIHWYTGLFHDNIKKVRDKYPDLTLINTEMCCGFSKYNESDWVYDAELYLQDIIGSMNNGLNAYLDWNILLDYNGGPSHKDNFVKSVIILNKNKNDIIKTPIYYYLYHIAHFVNKGYKIIESNSFSKDVMVVGLKRDNCLVVIVFNASGVNYEYSIDTGDKVLKDRINNHSIITYVIK